MSQIRTQTSGCRKLLSAFCILTSTLTAHASRVEIREGKFRVDGEPFYAKCVGYNSLRPHQKPGVSYTGVNYRWMEMDFKRIKAAHFNTVRTWNALDPEELALAQKYGLMVLQGIWLDPKQDFSDPHNQDSCVAQVQSVVEQSKEFDNILGYVLMTEPSLEAVLESGQAGTLQFFRRLKRTIQAVDPRPVSMDSWLPLAFLDHSLWDFAAFNTYAFAPQSITHALGFAGYNRWLVDRFGKGRPLVIGETGGYAVSKSSVSHIGAGGYGGLSEYDQSLKDLDSLRATVEGHTDGACLVSWVDTWYYPTDPDTHDDEPWEWNGILGIPTDNKKEMEGIPRQVYEDLAAYNVLIPIEPKANHIYTVEEPVPIHVYAEKEVAQLLYSLNGAEGKLLSDSGHGWWHGYFKLPALARRRQRITFTALDKDRQTLASKDISFVANVFTERVQISSAETRPGTGHSLSFNLQVTREDGLAVARRKVYFGFFFPHRWREAQGVVTTDAAGRATITCPLSATGEDHFLYVAAGTDSPERVRSGDMKIFEIGRK